MFLIALSLFFSPQPAFADTIIVNGTDGDTIQDAINLADSGDTIEILAGTYAETLNLQSESLTIQGNGIGSTIIDASLQSGFAIQNFGDGTIIRDLTLIGTPDNYGFKVAGVSNITLQDIKVENSEKTGIDLNGVNGATLTSIEVTDTANGFGINMVDSNDITLTDITTSDNLWGGVSIQTEGFHYLGGSDGIQFLGAFDASEDNPLLLEQDPCRANGGAGGCTEGEYSNITNAQLPGKFEYVFYGLRSPGTEDYRQWFYQETVEDASSLGQALMGAFAYSGMLIHDIAAPGSVQASATDIDIDNFYVIEGLTIQDAIDAAGSGDTINIFPGDYTESAVCPWPMCGGAPTVGLFINKNDITLLGVDADGNPVNDAADVQAFIAAAGKADFSFLNAVVADDVTIQGLGFVRDTITGYFKTIEVMGDNLIFVHNAVDNSGATGTSTMYFDVNPNVLHPNINEDGAAGSVDNFELANNIFTGGEVTVAGGVGIQHTFTESGTVDGFPTYTPVWDPDYALVPGAVRTIADNEFKPETGQTQDNGLTLTGYMPGWWAPDAFTVPTGPVTITDNAFRSGLDNPVLLQGGQNADDPITPVVDLATVFDDNIFDQAVLVTTDAGRTSVRNETGTVGAREFPIYAIQSSIQDGINLAEAGDFVWVGAGTYDEQLIVDVDVTIQGAGSSTIIQPSQTTADGFALFSRSTSLALNSAPILVTGDDAADVTVKDMQIDGSLVSSVPAGANGFFGILFRGTNGLIDSVTVHDIDGIFGQGDNAIYISSMGEVVSVEVANSNVFAYGKNGITGNFDGLTVDIHDNTATGVGATPNIAQNGIQIGFGASGSVIGNTVDDHFCTEVTTCLEDPTTSPVADGASGILLYATTGTIEVAENTLSGNQFGIWAVGAAAVNIHDNTLTGGSGTGISVWDRDQWTVLLSESAVSTAGSIDDNVVTLHDFGIIIRDYDSAEAPYDDATESEAPDVEAHLNKIANNAEFGAWSNGNVTMDAANNYWGSTTGPFHATENPGGLGNDVSDNIEFKPYYIDSGLAALSSDKQVVADEEVEVDEDSSEVVIPEGLVETTITIPPTVTNAKVNVAPSVSSSNGTKQAIVNTTVNINATTSVGQVQVKIPSGIKITADNSWDGSINVPTIKPTSSVTVTPSDEDVEVDEVLTVIEIGFDDVALEFDTGVRILIPDMAGNLIGYSRAGTFTPITTECSADTQAAGDALPAGGDCKIDAGDDLAVWTKHFTSFVVYSEAPVAADEDDGPSGGGGGSRGPVVITWPTEIVTTLPESHFLEFPLDRIRVASSAFINAGGAGINQAGVGQQLSISSTFTNYQERLQDYAFIVQIMDENDSAIDIAWQTGIIESGATAQVSTLWTPEADGIYTVEIFVWNSVSTAPEALSQVTIKNIKVTE